MLPDRMLPYWDSENNEISVEKAFPKSTRPAHWIDPVCGYQWVQRVGTLTIMFDKVDSGLRASVCPSCEGNAIIKGKNDLLSTHPQLFAMWSTSNTFKMDDTSKGSAKIVEWNCANGHVWTRKIKDQARAGAVCPKCKPPKSEKAAPCRKTQLLKDTHPAIFAEAVRVISSDRSLESLSSSGNLGVEWRCPKAHLYVARISNRTLLGRNCPYCAGRYAIAGENDIATTNPEVMAFWDYETNTVSPLITKKSSNKPIHWVCNKNHKWISIPDNLTTRKQYCPYCSGKKVIVGETDFASAFPEKVKLWDYDKNTVSPNEISANNAYRAHWKCDLGHEWDAPIYSVAAQTSNNTSTTGCPVCAGHSIVLGFNDFASNYPELLQEWHYEKNHKEPQEYTKASGQSVWWICSKNHEWQTTIGHRAQGGNGCPECACGINVSKAERLISDWVTALLSDELVMTNTRKIVKGFEMDIYIPSKKIAIEYNGVYWHSEAAGKDKHYHYDKWKACKDKGIQLIQIWEDEWNRNPEQIKRMLAHKLGISNERKVFARKTTVVELTKMEAEPFLNENHVQGYASGSYYLGLKDKGTDELVSVLVLKKEGGSEGKVLNIIRYATSANVVGGFTKLLSYSTKTYQPDSYLTFSDHCVSDGGLYANHGFIADKELPPDYMYVVGNVRKHKFGYRLKRFKDDPALLWEEGLTERELAYLNGLKRIWDAGKTRWVLQIRKITNMKD